MWGKSRYALLGADLNSCDVSFLFALWQQTALDRNITVNVPEEDFILLFKIRVLWMRRFIPAEGWWVAQRRGSPVISRPHRGDCWWEVTERTVQCAVWSNLPSASGFLIKPQAGKRDLCCDRPYYTWLRFLLLLVFLRWKVKRLLHLKKIPFNLQGLWVCCHNIVFKALQTSLPSAWSSVYDYIDCGFDTQWTQLNQSNCGRIAQSASYALNTGCHCRSVFGLHWKPTQTTHFNAPVVPLWSGSAVIRRCECLEEGGGAFYSRVLNLWMSRLKVSPAIYRFGEFRPYDCIKGMRR